MAKRRLSKQQQQRIARNQARAGSDAQASTVSHEDCNGLIVSHFGQQLDVECLRSTASCEAGTIVRCHQRANLPALVTGDRVVWEAASDGSGVILAQGQRASLFSRADSHGGEKPIAANIDLVLVVIAAVPMPFMNLIDRYLVAVEHLGLRACLVLNKVDLLADSDSPELQALVQQYEDLAYPVYRVSATGGDGMDALNEALSGKTAVLVGQSGVGKSSLLNRLAGSDEAAVGALSVGKDKGTHTTTTARLFHLLHCNIIDSPGIREFSLGPLSKQEITAGFIELRELAGHCRFRNCSHGGEPDCAVAQALTDGRLSRERWQSYQHILGTL